MDWSKRVTAAAKLQTDHLYKHITDDFKNSIAIITVKRGPRGNLVVKNIKPRINKRPL